MGGTLQLEIAEVLEPLYRAGEEWEKLHQIYEVQLARMTDVERAPGAAAPPRRDRRAEAGRSGRRLRLVGPGRQGGPVVRAGARRAACAWRARRTSGTPTSRRCRRRRRRIGAPPGPARRAAAPRGDLRDRPRRPRARRERAGAGAAARTRRMPAALASLDRIYEAQGMYENLAAALRQRIAITDDTDELVALQLRLGRVYAEALDDVERRHRQLPGRARARVALASRRSRRSSASTSAASAGPSCTASTRSWSTSPSDERRWPTATRAWPSSRPTPSASARRPSSCGAACSTCAATTHRAGGPRRPARGWPASGRS